MRIATRGLRIGVMGAVLLMGAMPANEDVQDTPRRQEMTAEVRRAVERGLQFLVSQQQADGSWVARIGHKLYTGYRGEEGHHVGVTALSCMALMAAGNTPGRGPHGDNVERGLRFVLSCVRDEDGYITREGSRMYSHAYATLFLADVYGMTGRDDVGERLRRAVALIVNAQNPEGGWRYSPQPIDADLSITVSTIQALRAARNAGVAVPADAIERAMNYVRGCARNQGREGFNYQLAGDADQRVTFPLTACGVVSMFSAGEYDAPVARNALGALERLIFNTRFDMYGSPPPLSSDHYFFFYGHFYASQAFYVAGGLYWDNYQPAISRILLASQRADGSWTDEVDGAPGVGHNFSTAMGLLILQMPVEWLPIFQR